MPYGVALIDGIQSSGNLAITGNVSVVGIMSSNNVTLLGALRENIFTITDGASVDLNPANGTVQLWTLGASRTPTANSFLSGQSMTLMINSGSNAITWTSVPVTWVGGTAPALSSTGFNVIELWRTSTVIYGAFIGPA